MEMVMVGVVSQFKHGGFVVFEENGHGIVAAITDLGRMDWASAKTACDELILNGYSDWHLPSKEELNLVYDSLGRPVKRFADYYYWSSTEGSDYDAWAQQYFNNGEQKAINKNYECTVRAVRAF